MLLWVPVEAYCYIHEIITCYLKNNSVSLLNIHNLPIVNSSQFNTALEKRTGLSFFSLSYIYNKNRFDFYEKRHEWDSNRRPLYHESYWSTTTPARDEMMVAQFQSYIGLQNKAIYNRRLVFKAVEGGRWLDRKFWYIHNWHFLIAQEAWHQTLAYWNSYFDELFHA